MAVRFSVHVRPGASRVKVGGTHGDALVVAVQAIPVEGSATTAVLAAVADALGVRRRSVRLVQGARTRDKVVEVTVPGDIEEIVRKQLDELRAENP